MSTRRSDDRNRKVEELGLRPINILLLSTLVGAAVLAAPVWAQGHTDTTDGHSGSGGAGGGHDSTDGTDHGAGGPGGPSGSGGGHDGSDGDYHDTEEGHSGGQGAGGQGGQGGSGQGGQAGNGQGRGQGGSGNSGGGRPVWAQEGLPQVELGRLNVGRSPDQVIDRAFDEALSGFTEDVAAFYRLDLAQMEEMLSKRWGDVNLIDSPLQNLALFRDALDGTSVLRDVGITTNTDTLLAAFLGTASDKEIPITQATVQAVSILMGNPMSPTEAAALAEKAERIRKAILAGHG